MVKKDGVSPKAKRVRSEFTPLHFMPDRLRNEPNQYVLLGLNGDEKLVAKRLTHEEAVAFAQGSHPDKRVPVDNDPAHDIIYVWNDAINEYVPQS